MDTAEIRFATDILRRLGEELNPSPVEGVVELVKNAYDADARWCRVQLIDTHQPGGTVVVSDDGDGMDAQSIVNGWLVLGKSDKSRQQVTRLGRTPAGNKGLGRLAALRLGSKTTLLSRPRSDKSNSYRLEIDWVDFKEVDLVNEVQLNIERVERLQGEKQGTEITLTDVSSHFGRLAVRRLARSLILLADPFGDDSQGFKPELVATEFEDLEKLVQNRYFQDAEYHLMAEVDAEGIASASVVDWRGEKLFSSTHDELSAKRSRRPYLCPAARFDLWVFLLDSAAFSTRRTTLKEVRSWLKEFGGVHIYENGLRVAPYGDAGNDWLELNLRRSRSPEERPSTNTVIGRVSVTDKKGVLVQKTDRSGFIENEPFSELRAFAQDATEWLATRRMEIANQRRTMERSEAPKKASKSRKNLQQAIGDAPPTAQQQLNKAFSDYDRSREREVRALQKEVQLYRTLGTAGITAATFAHESSGNPIKVITQSIKAIERRAKQALDGQYEEVLRRPVESVTNAAKTLSVLGGVTLNLVDHEKRRQSRVEIHAVLMSILDTFEPFLTGRDVSVKLDFFAGDPYLRGTDAALESIIINLLNNSLTAFERSISRERIIELKTTLEGDTLVIRVLDSGPGIEDISIKDIWLPGERGPGSGTGLGLAIVRDAVNDLGGRVRAIEHGELGGAEFVVSLPILGY